MRNFALDTGVKAWLSAGEMKTENEKALHAKVWGDKTPSLEIKSAYQQLVQSIADRVASEFGAKENWDVTEAALISADKGDEGDKGVKYFERFEENMRAAHAQLAGGVAP